MTRELQKQVRLAAEGLKAINGLKARRDELLAQVNEINAALGIRAGADITTHDPAQTNGSKSVTKRAVRSTDSGAKSAKPKQDGLSRLRALKPPTAPAEPKEPKESKQPGEKRKRELTPEGRQRIREAQARRWGKKSVYTVPKAKTRKPKSRAVNAGAGEALDMGELMASV